MDSTDLPRVLVVDDEPDDQRAKLRVGPEAGAEFQVLHPDDVTCDDLAAADLVLVDYILKVWPGREKCTKPSLQPQNGVALASVLREWTRQAERPTGFALHTAQPESLWIAHPESRNHVIARAYNLEWVFLKWHPAEVVRQAAIMANAIGNLPSTWPADDHAETEYTVRRLLGFTPSAEDETRQWHLEALRDVANCRPPVTELSEANHGLLFLRWLLQRIMPYPCFLHDTHRLAARLRATHRSVAAAIPLGLGEWLKESSYSGIAAGFLNDRWWRVGIENQLWDITEGASIKAEELRRGVERAAGVTLEPDGAEETVCCVDQDYRPLEEPQPISTVVRIQPDDWPAFASQAWTTVTMANEHPRLRAMVIADDEDRLT